MENQKLPPFNYIGALFRWKRFILVCTIAGTIIAAGVSLLIPKSYRAEAIIIPPEEKFRVGFGSFFDSRKELLYGMGTGGMGLFQETEVIQRYIAILNTRSVFEKVINKFDLWTLYEEDTLEDVIKTLKDYVKFEPLEEGTLYISVEDKGPQRASDMTNYFVALLDSINKNLQSREAQFNREFLEKRLNRNLKELAEAEIAYQKFLEENNVIDISEQTGAAIEAASLLLVEINMLEVDMQLLGKSVGPNHPDYLEAKTRLDEYRKRLSLFIEPREDLSSNPMLQEESSLFIPFMDVPELEIQYIRVRRDMETQNKIYQLLIEQLEMAKLLEAKDTPTLQVLDYAIPPTKKYKPKRTLITILTCFSLFFVTCGIALTYEFYRQYV